MPGGRLRKIYPSKFRDWVLREGFETEKEFWQSLAGGTGSELDLMNEYLGSLGYVGTPRDKLRVFLMDQVGFTQDATFFDLGNQFFEQDFSVDEEVSQGITTEAGDALTTEGGDQLFTEGS